MIKLNNKGFAISTVIYGLSIMGVMIVAILMGIMSTTRANNREFAKTVEDELNRVSRTETTLAPTTTGTLQEYTVPRGESGWYRIELCGAQGGTSGGLGAYTSGVIYLEADDTIYIYVGRQNKGESTDVRITPGGYKDSNSYQTRIMVAAGGGKDPGASGGTLYGYTKLMTPTGGNIRTIDTAAGKANYKLEKGNLIGSPDGYRKSEVSQQNGVVPKPSQNDNGGDGYYSSSRSDTGGTSFISGYVGSKSYNYSSGTLSDSPVSVDGKQYVFYDGRMIAGTNAGPGRATIKRIVKKTDTITSLPRKNNKLDNVTAIRDCVSTNNPRPTTKIQAISNGNPIIGIPVQSDKPGYYCSTLNIGSSQNLDEIAVWHTDNVDYQNHTIAVQNNRGWEYVKAPATDSHETKLSETETVTGIRISAYQPDYTQALPPSGTYYIIPVLSDNKVISAKKIASDDNQPVMIEPLVGDKRQMWAVELIDEKLRKSNDEYKIVDLARFKALSIHLDENKLGNGVYTPDSFNNYSRNDTSIWKFIPVGNGTYRIETVVDVFDDDNPTGNLCANTSKIEPVDTIVISQNYLLKKEPEANDTQRFKLIALD